MDKNPGIVFMGTPEFAVASLDAIFKAGYDIRGVITMPDKPSGRGLQLHQSPVKEYALAHGLKVLQPLKLKDPDFLKELKSLDAGLQVIVAFRMLPEEVWNMPPMGTFNLHASLLPQYRGAAPINWAVINGEKKTGVTTFFLNHEIDKGSVIHRRETEIGENENAGDIHDRLMEMGAELVVETIRDIISGKARGVAQDMITEQGELRPAPKIFREDCRIRWDQESIKVHNFIRGLSPFPTAWTEFESANGVITGMKIYEARPMYEPHNHTSGTIVTDGKTFLKVATKDGFINILKLQQQARKQMGVEEFLRGAQPSSLRGAR
ncbi:MAG TPA: methionyl-tRNA formyltransferase [Bacteroidales bacterium]|nr:methionyl-tRNA formyltransferase [Bacteroidales bacterium]